MKIQTITKYTYKGKEYKSLKELQDEIYNIIGEEVIDKINKTVEIRHKDLFKLLDILCEPEVRKVLTEVLNIEYSEYNEYEDKTEVFNILDLK